MPLEHSAGALKSTPASAGGGGHTTDDDEPDATDELELDDEPAPDDESAPDDELDEPVPNTALVPDDDPPPNTALVPDDDGAIDTSLAVELDPDGKPSPRLEPPPVWPVLPVPPLVVADTPLLATVSTEGPT